MPERYKTIERAPEKAMSLIERKFTRLQRILKRTFRPTIGAGMPFSTETLSHMNSDGSIAIDFRIMNINPKIDIDQLLIDIHTAIDQTAVNGAWLSVGFYNPPSVAIESEIGYRKNQGMIFYRTHSRRWTKQNSVLIIEQARDSTEKFSDKYGHVRPLGIVLRSWWNILGDRPKYRHNKPEVEGEQL